MEIKWLTYKDPEKLKNIFIHSYLDIYNDPLNLKYLSFSNEPFSEKQVYDWVFGLNNSSDIKYIYAEELGNIIGICVLKIVNKDTVEIFGIGVNSSYKRKGAATLILKAALMKFNKCNFNSKVFEDNLPMISLLTKFNFKFSTFNEELRNDGIKLAEYVKDKS